LSRKHDDISIRQFPPLMLRLTASIDHAAYIRRICLPSIFMASSKVTCAPRVARGLSSDSAGSVAGAVAGSASTPAPGASVYNLIGTALSPQPHIIHV